MNQRSTREPRICKQYHKIICSFKEGKWSLVRSNFGTDCTNAVKILREKEKKKRRRSSLFLFPPTSARWNLFGAVGKAKPPPKFIPECPAAQPPPQHRRWSKFLPITSARPPPIFLSVVWWSDGAVWGIESTNRSLKSVFLSGNHEKLDLYLSI